MVEMHEVEHGSSAMRAAKDEMQVPVALRFVAGRYGKGGMAGVTTCTRRNSHDFARRSQDSLEKLEPTSMGLRCATEPFQQPQRTRRHPHTKIGVICPCAGRSSNWAVPAPGGGPFHASNQLEPLCAVTKRGAAWEPVGDGGGWRRKGANPKIAERRRPTGSAFLSHTIRLPLTAEG
ncbi:hypothetical protein BU23DRAFT_568881 [Bimuria novae-zelandiae CBS 107.79]|uniref:Uncharacterized protein n=1 Tax=Bimuria novae-zelandiae CBS 107.79 TaxID=1447943 RepID=A0A6A5V7M0_9PLEO|nr:hypothetical protein BU23DRAFT_568881 [Bimuria novae-zelandiae CBS 107.79]